ncbi:hypothetical protein A3Q56_08556, partial [Intoshia linei]
MPSSILLSFKKKNIESPLKSKLITFLSDYKKNTFGPSIISLSDISDICKELIYCPELTPNESSMDVGFVLDFKISNSTKSFI